MVFLDRDDAGRALGDRLRRLSLTDPVVLALPRGGVPVGYRVAWRSGLPWTSSSCASSVFRSSPSWPWAPSVRTRSGCWTTRSSQACGIGVEEIAAIEAHERQEVLSRARRYRAGRSRVPLGGRTAVVVDDGMATGSTARAACLVARAQGAAAVVMAVPVASSHAVIRLRDASDSWWRSSNRSRSSPSGSGTCDSTRRRMPRSSGC